MLGAIKSMAPLYIDRWHPIDQDKASKRSAIKSGEAAILGAVTVKSMTSLYIAGWCPIYCTQATNSISMPLSREPVTPATPSFGAQHTKSLAGASSTAHKMLV